MNRFEEHPTPRMAPMNVVDSGRCLNGLLKTRNLMEGICLCGPILCLLILLIPNTNIYFKVQVISISVGVPFILALIGIPPYSLIEFLRLIVKFKNTKHFALYNPKMKLKTTPDFLVHGIDLPIGTQLKNSFDVLFGDGSGVSDDKVVTYENCTNEIHYKDDESEKEWRKKQKAKEKDASQKAKILRKKNKKDEKLAQKQMAKNQKIEKKNAKKALRHSKKQKKRGVSN